MNQETIVVNGLTRYFNGICAVNDLSFSVNNGEIFGFLGPNGAGKTTTLRILTGQLLPSSGEAWVAGCDVVKERQALKPRIGVVFEVQNLYKNLSARENLYFSAGLYGVDKGRIEEVLHQVQLTNRANDPLKKYSNGMKQRLLIARALLHYPQVLFLDEPTRGLDPNIARGIRSLVSNLAKDGMTVFLTTHYMEEADQMCGRVAILNQGRIVALDQPNRLKKLYGEGEHVSLEDVFVSLTGRTLALE